MSDPETFFGLGITLTNNEIKDIIKVIKYLENRGILSKKSNRKIASQEGGFLNFLKLLMTADLPLMKSILTPLAKNVLILFELIAAAASDAALIISNEEMEDITKIIKSFEESGLLIKGISETIKNEAKEQKDGFLPLLLGTLAASILGNKLTGRRVIRAGKGTNKSCQK